MPFHSYPAVRAPERNVPSREALRLLPGFRIGHASDFRGLTGCTVILTEGGAACGVDVGGSAAGTRDLAACLPGHIVERLHAVFLTGGSAFGLDAAAGVMRYLESRRVGFPAGKVRVPIVPGAVIFDLNLGSARARPTPEMAYRACRTASTQVAEGCVGAGTGATVGKLLGIRSAMKSGVGFCSLRMAGPSAAVWAASSEKSGNRAGAPGRAVAVQALAVVNAFGDIVDPTSGAIIAGTRASPTSAELVGTAEEMLRGKTRHAFGATNTTLVVVMTNAALTKLQATKVAQMAQDGLARSLRPVHTQFDGDLVFTLSTGTHRADLSALGTAAAEAVAQAILRAARAATSLGGLPSLSDLANLARRNAR
jgi:L-aminopeptidase/D-esterase-like protein